ncbi:RHS repeat-associated core domain-containing protein [Luteolibacter sp. LG18]|uniref:RHS repeat domain-containing protein n=1 Tax=Luteolibacter sp. LG18 TaxID=2819286 RepID=UPI002B288420|nr:hypothetical protein llg_42470 [Luteolibacter sp. LG18]
MARREALSGVDLFSSAKIDETDWRGVEWRRDVKAHATVSTQDAYYTYDGLQQVTSYNRGDLTPSSGPPYTGVATVLQAQDLEYDQTGNWKNLTTVDPTLDQDRTHNTANQITSFSGGPSDPEYDANGNMTLLPSPSDWDVDYGCTWDAWNRLVRMVQNEELEIDLCEYDALSRRVRKQTGSEDHHYYFNNQWRTLEERVDAGDLAMQYTWSPLDRWTLIRRLRSVEGDLDESLWCLRDYLDPVAIVQVVDDEAVVQERYRYNAFGTRDIMTPAFEDRASSDYEWNFLFHAEFQDDESQLYNYGYRYYNTQLGRWISRDPIGESGGINLYGYIYNRSLNFNDYLGWYAINVYWPTNDGFAFVHHDNPGDNRWFWQAAGGDDSDPEFKNGNPSEPTNKAGNVGNGVSGADFLKFLVKKSSHECCIKKLRDSSHCSYDGAGLGGGGGADVFRGFYTNKDIRDPKNPSNKHGIPVSSDARDLSDLRNLINDGKVKFCKDCKIDIFACASPGASAFIMGLAKVTKCKVVGAVGGESCPAPGKGGNDSCQSSWKTEGTWQQSDAGGPLNPAPNTTNNGHIFNPNL